MRVRVCVCLRLVFLLFDVFYVFTLSQTASDFCVSPDTYITRATEENSVINQGMLPT